MLEAIRLSISLEPAAERDCAVSEGTVQAVTVADKIAEFFQQHASASILGLLGVYASLALIAARVRPLWFDELGTWIVASQPTLHKMLIAEPPDGQPPLYYLLARISMAIFGHNAFALRLPALLSFLVAGYCIHLFVQRRTETVFGLLAAFTLCASSVAWYSMEARPYATMLAGTSVALVCWQSAVDGYAGRTIRARLYSLAGLSLGIAIAILSHPYGIFYVAIPLLAGESVRVYRRRTLDLALCSAALLGLTALAITIPMIHRSRVALFSEMDARPIPVAEPTVARLYVNSASIVDSSPVRLLLLMVVAGLYLGRRRSLSNFPWGTNIPATKTESRSGIPDCEMAAALGLVSLGIAAWIVSRFVTHYYFRRYGIGSALGIAVLTAYLAWLLPFRRMIALALLAALCHRFISPPWPALQDPLPRFGGSELIDRGDQKSHRPGLPVVMASALEFLPVWYYADPALRGRLHYIADREARGALPDRIGEITIAAEAATHSLPMTLDKLGPFLDRNPTFLLYCTRDGKASEWLPDELRRRAYTFTTVATRIHGHDPAVLYVVSALPLPR